MAALTPGRSGYELYAPETGCKADHRYERLDSIGEKFLLDMNNVDYSGLVGFRTSNSYLWFRFFRRIIEWRPECLSEVPRLFSMTGEIRTTYTICFVLTILIFVVVGLGIVFILGQMTIPFKTGLDSSQVYGCYRARIYLIAAVCPLTLVLIWRTYPVFSYFGRTISKGCSDPITNIYFEDLLNSLKYHVFFFYLGLLLLTVILLALELAEFFIERKRRREEWAQLQKPEVDIAIL